MYAVIFLGAKKISASARAQLYDFSSVGGGCSSIERNNLL